MLIFHFTVDFEYLLSPVEHGDKRDQHELWANSRKFYMASAFIYFSSIHMLIALVMIAIVFLSIRYLTVSNSRIISKDVSIDEQVAYEQTLSFVKSLHKSQKLDAIFVCGGGRPSKTSEPPLYVQSRCDISVLLYNHSKQMFGQENAPKILCLSAGTAHTPQLLNDKRLPVWESQASAQYILDKYSSFVDRQDIYIETVSYDTIGNAYFAKILFSDVLKWKNIAIISNDWHFKRTKAIFEWIYSIKSNGNDDGGYDLTFVSLKSTEHKDLSQSAREARMEREEKSLKNVYKLRQRYNTLEKLHGFLFTKHSMYACPKQDMNHTNETASEADKKLMAAYGFRESEQ